MTDIDKTAIAFCFRSACRAPPVVARRAVVSGWAGKSRFDGLTAAGACGGGKRPSAGFAVDDLAPLPRQ
jgi:hypothetical protein